MTQSAARKQATKRTAPAPAAPAEFANRMRWGPRAMARLAHEPALAITAAYLFVGAVGLWSSYWYYLALGIPVLEYYQVSDFLIAGLRDPFNFVILSVALAVGLLSYSSAWYELHHPERVAQLRRTWWGWLWFNRFASPHRRRRWYDLSPELVLGLGVLLGGGAVMSSHARDRADALRAGAGTPLRITLQGEASPLQGEARLAGTSSSHVFLFWPANGRSEALPSEAVSRIEHLPRRPLRSVATAKAKTP